MLDMGADHMGKGAEMKIGLWVGYILCGLILLSSCLIPWITSNMYYTAMAKLDDPGRDFRPGSSVKTSDKSSPSSIPETEVSGEASPTSVPSVEPMIPSLPPMVTFTPREEGDFLADESRFKQFTELVYAYRYSDVKAMVDGYLNANSPPKTDSAYKVLDVLQTFNSIALMSKCTASEADAEAPSKSGTDNAAPIDADKKPVYISYNGVSTLASGGGLVPYISTLSGAFLRVGYMSAQNVTYGSYTLTAGSGDVTSGSLPGWNPEQIKNAPTTMPAAADIPIRLSGETQNDAQVEKLLAASQITIRYADSNGQTVKSYTATQNEKDALSAIYTLYRTQAMLLAIATGS